MGRSDLKMPKTSCFSDESCFTERGVGGRAPARNGEQDDGGGAHGRQAGLESHVACCTNGEDRGNGGEEEREEGSESGADGNRRQGRKGPELGCSEESSY